MKTIKELKTSCNTISCGDLLLCDKCIYKIQTLKKVVELIKGMPHKYGTHQVGNDMHNCIDPDELTKRIEG